MNKLELVLTEEAYKDIDNISDYIALDNTQAAKNTVDLLYQSCYTLTLFPNLGSYRDGILSKDTKIFIINKQFLIAYKIVENKLVVLKITTRYRDICSLL